MPFSTEEANWSSWHDNPGESHSNPSAAETYIILKKPNNNNDLDDDNDDDDGANNNNNNNNNNNIRNNVYQITRSQFKVLYDTNTIRTKHQIILKL